MTTLSIKTCLQFLRQICHTFRFSQQNLLITFFLKKENLVVYCSSFLHLRLLYRPIVGNATSNEKKRVIVKVSNNFIDTEGDGNDSGCSFDHG